MSALLTYFILGLICFKCLVFRLHNITINYGKYGINFQFLMSNDNNALAQEYIKWQAYLLTVWMVTFGSMENS